MTRRFSRLSTHCPAAHGLGHRYIDGRCVACKVEQCEGTTSYDTRCSFPKEICRYHRRPANRLEEILR